MATSTQTLFEVQSFILVFFWFALSFGITFYWINK